MTPECEHSISDSDTNPVRDALRQTARQWAAARLRSTRRIATTALVRSLCGSILVTALVCATAATAQDSITTTTGASSATSEPFQVTIVSPEKGSTIPASGEISFRLIQSVRARQSGVSFRCTRDAVTLDPCTSPVPYGPLPPGHQLEFAVSALVAGAPVGADRTAYTIAEAPTPLTVTIISGPSGVTKATAATFAFRANRADAAFRCGLDGVVAACSSPRLYDALATGTHVFTVIAAAGHQHSMPDRAVWTVTAAQPPPAPKVVITSAPERRTAAHRAQLAFTAIPAASGFQCSLDNSTFSKCDSPRTYDHLPRGPHTFSVHALSSSGVPGPTATARWVVAVPPPSPPGHGPSWPAIPLAALAAVVAAIHLTRLAVHRASRARHRSKWQLEAHSQPPDQPCSERSHYCQKTAVKLKRVQHRIVYLDLHARGDDHADLRKRVHGRVVKILNQALRDYRRAKDREPLRIKVLPVADQLLTEIEFWLANDAVHNEVTADAHVVTAEVEFEFNLYGCRAAGNCGDCPQWEKEQSWTASLEHELEQRAFRLNRARPLDAESATDQLIDLLTKVDAHTSIEISNEAILTP